MWVHIASHSLRFFHNERERKRERERERERERKRKREREKISGTKFGTGRDCQTHEGIRRDWTID
jgi:hypothetical protein